MQAHTQVRLARSRLEEIVDTLGKKGVRPHYMVNCSSEHKVDHDFTISRADRTEQTIHYIRGFTVHGSEFEAYIPEKQSGQVIAHLAGLGVMPSSIETAAEAKKTFGTVHERKRTADVLYATNTTGYYGNTLLQTAREGRASIVVYAKGFNREVKGLWQKLRQRLVTDITAKQQLQDAIALGEVFSTEQREVALASHSLTTQEAIRFLADPHSYTLDDYCHANSVKTMIFQAMYTTPEDALRNTEPVLSWVKKIVGTNKSFFWRPLFDATSYLYKKLGLQIPGVQPFFSDFKKYQLSDFYHNKKVPKAWKQAMLVNAASAAYVLESPYAALKQKPKDTEFLRGLRYIAFIPEQDAICSAESQRKLCDELNKLDTSGTIQKKLFRTTLEGYGHNIFVDYPTSFLQEMEILSRITGTRKEYNNYLLQITG